MFRVLILLMMKRQVDDLGPSAAPTVCYAAAGGTEPAVSAHPGDAHLSKGQPGCARLQV